MRCSDARLGPLSNDEFAELELERHGRRKLPQEIRTALNVTLDRAVGSYTDKVQRRQKRSSKWRRWQRKLLLQIDQDFERLLAKLDRLPRNMMTELVLPEETMVRRAQKGVAQRAKRLPHRKPGPKLNIWYLEFFVSVADSYQAAGGRVSAAAYRGKGRNSPFIRFLRYLHYRLPKKQRMAAPQAIEEWAHRTGIPEWKARQG